MSYAIISVGGKQYRVREGERLLVDRVGLDDGATFTPRVLLVGGDGDVAIAPADVTVIDPRAEWTVRPEAFLSKSRNSPFAGWKLRGRAALTLVGGRIVWDASLRPAGAAPS